MGGGGHEVNLCRIYLRLTPYFRKKVFFYILCTILGQRDHCIPPEPFFVKVSSIVYIHVKAYQSKEIFQLIFVSVLQPSSDISIYKMGHLFPLELLHFWGLPLSWTI